MIQNRSMPRCAVIPELAYSDVGEAIAWLSGAFGFTVRIQMGNHRAQLNIGDGAVVLTELRGRERHGETDLAHAVMVRVHDVDIHHAHAQQHGARVLGPPTDYPYGERQYTVVDLGGHYWTFSQSIADVDPTDWGGTPGTL